MNLRGRHAGSRSQVGLYMLILLLLRIAFNLVNFVDGEQVVISSSLGRSVFDFEKRMRLFFAGGRMCFVHFC